MTEPLAGRSDAAADPSPHTDTRTKLLDAAEQLFAHEGVDKASLRAITHAAGANLAAVHYHFGSKKALVREVLERRLSPLNERRLQLLDAAERDHPNPPLEVLLRAFVEPTLDMVQKEGGGHAFARFVCRTFSEPEEQYRDLVMDQFREIVTQFARALERALPDLPREEMFWRFHFMVGSMVHTAGMGFIAHRLSDGLCDPTDVEGIAERLVAFLAGGFKAAATDNAA